MWHRPLLLAALLLAPAALADPGDALADFMPGLYAANPIGRSGLAHRECLTDPRQLVLGNRALGACQVTRIATDPQQTVMTWKCNGQATGRTSVRRDSAGVYTVHLQGVADALPFAEHAEWRRIGTC